MTLRNPFRIRSFQRASGDDQFVRLFASSALDVLEETDSLWDTLQYLRSAPGGGKTSLLRLLTPGPLRKVALLASRDAKFKKTAERLQALGVEGQPASLARRNFVVLTRLSRSQRSWAPRSASLPRAFLCPRRLGHPTRSAGTIGQIFPR